MDREISLKEYFTYHPPTSDRRKADHERINTTAYELAQAIKNFLDKINEIEDNKCREWATESLQGITIDDLRGKYDLPE